MRNDDPFTRFAIAGLAILFGTQSAVNMAVNLALIPAKGMTLPFISYGGSSMISLAYGMGMLLGLMRVRPSAEQLTPVSKPVARGARRLSNNASAPLVVVAAGGTGGHLFPAEALSVALSQRGAIVDLATDERATRYGAAFPARATHIIPSATLRKDDPRTYVTAPLSIVQGVMQARELLRRLAAGGGDRFWRLSDRAARTVRVLARRADADPRTERRARPRQPVARAVRARHRDRVSRRARQPSQTRSEGCRHRQSGAAGCGRGVENSLCAAGDGAVQAGRVRRQPGRPGDGRRGADRDRTSACRRARAACHRPAGARRGSGAGARYLRAAFGGGGGRAILSPTCRRASRRVI